RLLAIELIGQAPAVHQPGELHGEGCQLRPESSAMLQKAARGMAACRPAIGKWFRNRQAEQAMAKVKRGREIGKNAPASGEVCDSRPIQPVALRVPEILDVAQIAQAEMPRGMFHVLQLRMKAAEDEAVIGRREREGRIARPKLCRCDHFLGRQQSTLPAEMAMDFDGDAIPGSGERYVVEMPRID